MDPLSDVQNGPGIPPVDAGSISREEMLDALLQRYTVHARIVGHDFGLNVRWGEPLKGYSFQHLPPTVIIDPVGAMIDPDEGDFAVGHEGAHRYNTYSLLDPDISRVIGARHNVDLLARTIGFNAVFNGIEDPTINSWYTRVYEGAKEKQDRVYEKQFTEDAAKLYTPEVQLTELLLGHYPKFGQYLSRIIRKWFKGDWGENIDPQVEKVLRETEAVVDHIQTLTTKGSGAPEHERRQLCLMRYMFYIEAVWPLVKDLVVEDLKESSYQSFKDSVMKGAKGLMHPEPKESELQGNEASPDGTPQEGSNGDPQQGTGSESSDTEPVEGDKGSNTSGVGSDEPEQDDPGNGDANGAAGGGGTPETRDGEPEENPGSGQVAEAPQDKIDELLDGLPQHVKDELGKILKALKGEENEEPESGGQGASGEGDDTNRDPQEGAAGGSTEGEGAEGEPASGDPQAATGNQPANGTPEGKPRNGKPENGEFHGGEQQPGNGMQGTEGDPLDRALRDLFNSLLPAQRGGFEKRGEFNLKQFEDAINDYLAPKLVPNAVPSHGEQQATQERQQALAEQRVADEQLARELERYRLAQLGVWDAATERGGEQILQLTNLLRKDLKPTVPVRVGGFISGSGASLPHVRQDEARPHPNFKVMARTIVPKKKSFFFQFLADTSDSMNEYRKREFNLDAVTRGSEAIHRNRQPFELAVFDYSPTVVKAHSTPWTAEKREEAGQAILHCSGGTHDYKAIRHMAKRARGARAQYKILLVTTDGESNSVGSLKEALIECGKMGIIVIGFGIGPDTRKVNSNYPNGRGLLTLGDYEDPDSFVRYFSETIAEIVANPHRFKLFNEE